MQDLHRALIDALRAGPFSLTADASAALRATLAELSRGRARQGFTATETAVSVFALKDALLDVVGRARRRPAGAARLRRRLDAMVDELGLFTFESYARTREELIADQAEQLLELSTPVVKLWEGVVAVPLVGTLDSARAQVVMERLLQTLVDTGSPYAIIDITGVPAVDTQVAQHILKTVVAARLMGAECIISGIRPQIAQTIVALGIEFGDIATKATLADALRHALRHEVETAPQAAGALMERVPVLKIGDILLVSIQIDMEDQIALALQEDLAERIVATGCHGVIIDITGAGHRRLVRRPDAVHDRVDLAGARRRDGGGRHAAGGGDHAGRARACRSTASAPRSTSSAAWSCSPGAPTPTSSTTGVDLDDPDGRRRPRRDRGRRPGRATGRHDRPPTRTWSGSASWSAPSRWRPSCPWSTRPSWSPPRASWPATPWCTAVAARSRWTVSTTAGARASGSSSPTTAPASPTSTWR